MKTHKTRYLRTFHLIIGVLFLQAACSGSDFSSNGGAIQRPILESPSEISATAGVSSIHLSWSSVLGSSYKIYYGRISRNNGGVYDGEFANEGSSPIAVDGSSFSLTGLTNGLPVFISISTVSSTDESDLSEELIITPTLPAPGDVEITSGPGILQVNWGDVDIAEGYMVYWGTHSGDYGQQTGSTTTSFTIDSYQGAALMPGITYYVAVKALFQGESMFSSEVSASPLAGQSIPSTPSNLAAYPGDQSIFVSWSRVFNADQYILYYGTNSVALDSITIDQPLQSDMVVHTRNSLINGTLYYVTVSAVNGEGESAPVSPLLQITPLESTPPAPPQSLNLVAGNQLIMASWASAPPPSSVPDGYRIYWSDTHGNYGPTTVSETFHTITGLENGRLYHVWVVAFNDEGDSEASLIQSIALQSRVEIPVSIDGSLIDAGEGNCSPHQSGDWDGDANPLLGGIYNGCVSKSFLRFDITELGDLGYVPMDFNQIRIKIYGWGCVENAEFSIYEIGNYLEGGFNMDDFHWEDGLNPLDEVALVCEEDGSFVMNFQLNASSLNLGLNHFVYKSTIETEPFIHMQNIEGDSWFSEGPRIIFSH